MKSQHLKRLLYQALETEQAGVQIYETAIRCAANDELKNEWEECLAQTENHESILRRLLETVALAETRKHLNWELIRYGADYARRELGQTLAGFHREMEREGNDRLFQSLGWSRELWLAALGLPSLLQPLDEAEEVTAITISGRTKREPPAASRDSLKRL